MNHCQRLCYELHSGRFKHKMKQFIDWSLSRDEDNAIVHDCITFICARMTDYYEMYHLPDPFTLQQEEAMGKVLHQLILAKRTKE